jgi:hypothetical protein
MELKTATRGALEKALLFVFLSLICTSCCLKESCDIEPDIQFCTPPSVIENLPSAFPDLTAEELKEDWGKELLIANKFSRENDLYRAITGYKRALILLPLNHIQRQQQIEYDIILSYYLGEKYQVAVEAFEMSSLITVSNHFLAFDNLLKILYDSYSKAGQSAKAEKVYQLLEKVRPETALDFQHAQDVLDANFCALQNPCVAPNENLTYFLDSYGQNAKSVTKAKVLNAVLPGAGYYYIGQKNTAITAFIVNSLFIAAAYYFFDQGNWAAGAFTTSLEMGWYIGGINGAGLGAKEYNEHFYEALAKDYMIKRHLFPVLSFQTTF